MPSLPRFTLMQPLSSFRLNSVHYRTYREANKFCISHFEQILVVRLAYKDPTKTGRYGCSKCEKENLRGRRLLERRHAGASSIRRNAVSIGQSGNWTYSWRQACRHSLSKGD